MKCPLIKIVEQVASATLEVGVKDCIQEKCAWWNKRHGVCSIEVIGSVLEAISCSLADIASKPPLRRG